MTSIVRGVERCRRVLKPICVSIGVALLTMLQGCTERGDMAEPCDLADRPISLGVLAENSTRAIYKSCLDQRTQMMMEALGE